MWRSIGHSFLGAGYPEDWHGPDDYHVLVHARPTGEVVHDYDFASGGGAAQLLLKSIQFDLERMDLDAFLDEYGLEWRPA